MKNIFKKITIIALVIALFVPALYIYAANDSIRVKVNGETVDFTGDQAPYIDENGRTLVPIRKVFEKLGDDVVINYTEYNGKQMVVLTKGITNISLIIKNKYITIVEAGQSRSEKMDTAPIIKNGRTMLPARAVAEALGAKVTWNAEKRTVYIESDYKVEGGYVGDAELSIVSRDGKFGCIDKHRKIVIPIEYDSLDFNEFSSTKESSQADNFNNATYAITKATKGGKVSYLGIVREHKDSRGNTVSPRLDVFDYAEIVFGRKNYVYVQKGGKWGIIDASGYEAISVEYQEKPISMTYHGTPLFLVKKNGLFGISTLDNTLVADIKYTLIGMTDFTKAGNPTIYYQEGYVCALRDGVFGYIDTNGRELYPFNFQNVSPLENGKAKVIQDGEQKEIEIRNGRINFIYSNDNNWW